MNLDLVYQTNQLLISCCLIILKREVGIRICVVKWLVKIELGGSKLNNKMIHSIDNHLIERFSSENTSNDYDNNIISYLLLIWIIFYEHTVIRCARAWNILEVNLLKSSFSSFFKYWVNFVWLKLYHGIKWLSSGWIL